MRLGQPPHIDKYALSLIDGIKIYLPHGFSTNSPLKIDLENFLWMKNLRIEGWKLI